MNRELYIGLMSGTSLDGIDASLVEISTETEKPTFTTIESDYTPYSDKVRQFLQRLLTDRIAIADVCQANSLIAHCHAQAVKKLLSIAGIRQEEIRAIGFHGQTVHHQPEPVAFEEHTLRGTVQLGDAAILAKETGINVVSQFRLQDMALGGQGAPLVPAFDYYALSSRTESRVLCNIGGIANVTLLPAGCGADRVIAFDTGPGNVLMDLAMALITDGRSTYDNNGELARTAKPDPDLLDRMLREPYFTLSPPKSTGRELFNLEWLKHFNPLEVDKATLLATLGQLTARSIADGIVANWPSESKPDLILISGGGVKNKALLENLGELLPDSTIGTTAALGIDPDYKEAIAFAFLAWAFLHNKPGNLPSATGAQKESILGCYTPEN